jgi:HEAT repeat protein
MDRDSELRFDALQALRKIGGKEANAIFIDLLNDADADVRAAAARNIDLDGELTSMETILKMIEQKNFEKRSMVEKKALLEYLGASRSEDGLEALKKLLKRRSLFFRQRATETRICAAYGLEKCATEEALEALREQSRARNRRVRETCLAILYGMGEHDTE